MKKLFAVVALLAVAGCQPTEPEAAPDPAVTDIMALMGIPYVPGAGIEDRLRSALGLPHDFRIEAKVESGPFSEVWADNDPPVCSVRDGDTAEDVAKFYLCWQRARGDGACDVHVALVVEANDDGTLEIVGIDVWCGPPTDPQF